MSDLISKSKLLNTIATEVHYDTENPLVQYAKLIMLINDAPVEVEMEPLPNKVVRCRDCTRCKGHGDFGVCYLQSTHPLPVELDDYCSKARRRVERRKDAE